LKEQETFSLNEEGFITYDDAGKKALMRIDVRGIDFVLTVSEEGKERSVSVTAVIHETGNAHLIFGSEGDANDQSLRALAMAVVNMHFAKLNELKEWK